LLRNKEKLLCVNSFFGGGAIFILFYFSLFFRRFDLGIVRRGGGCFCIFLKN